ncbi:MULTISPECIES: hypothetical protein [unclassified Moraxella]|uniref:hypothetical protein n=2 Tax=Moraxella TaxID=475 RepID=UPI00359CF13C
MVELILNIDNQLKGQIIRYAEQNNISVNEMTERLWMDFLKEKNQVESLMYYRDCFDRLNCSKSHLGVAPHKPILLMSVIQLFERLQLSKLRDKITPQLESTFKKEWKKYVATAHTMNSELLLNKDSRNELYEFLVWRYFNNRQMMSEQENLLSQFKDGLDNKLMQFRVMLNDLWLPKVA